MSTPDRSAEIQKMFVSALTCRHFDAAKRPAAVAPGVIVFYGRVELSVRSVVVLLLLFCLCSVAVEWLIVAAIWPPAIVFAAAEWHLQRRCPAFCSSSAVAVAVEWSPVW